MFVLTDDLSMNLLRFMPHVRAMERDGLTFRNYFVFDSLCCPSRATILTGNFPHDTGVYGNYGRHGGFDAFYTRGEQQRTFAVALQRAGYLTALMGKYLNGYMGRPGTTDSAVARCPFRDNTGHEIMMLCRDRPLGRSRSPGVSQPTRQERNIAKEVVPRETDDG